jgi:hypothetical protein
MPREDQPRSRVGQVVRDLSRLEQRVHRDNDRAGPEHPVVDGGKRRDVRQHQADPVTGPDAVRGEQTRDPGAVLGQLRVADGVGIQPQSWALGLCFSCPDEVFGYVHRGLLLDLGSTSSLQLCGLSGIGSGHRG